MYYDGMSFAIKLNNVNIHLERNWLMQEIDREQAESLVNNNDVLNRHLQQNSQELVIFLTLANRQICIVKYHPDTRSKSYFIQTINGN